MNGTVQTLGSNLAHPGNTGTQLTKRKRVLIAESDGFTRMVLMLLFRMIGFGVDFTANGLIALGKLRSQPPDALLLELNLSGLPGLDLIKWVRSDPQFGNLRIYVFTDAEAMKRTVRKEVQLNVTKVFDKRSTTREDVVKNIILDLSATEVGIRLHPGPPENRNGASSKRILPGEFDQLVQGVRAQAESAAKCQESEARVISCRELLSRVSSLRSCAEVAGLKSLERHARGLAGFLNQLCRDRKACTDGRLSTVRCSVDVLGSLSGTASGDEPAQFSAVIVDESSPSGKSLSDALGRMGVNAVSFSDAAPALKHLGSNWVNLIVVNLPMPEERGLDLESIRRLPYHAGTPIIFVSEAAGSDTSKGKPDSVPLVNQDPLLLHELVLLALNQLHNIPAAGHQEPEQEPVPPAITTGPIPFGNEEETETTDVSELSSLFAALPPETSSTQLPADAQAWGAEAPSDGEVTLPDAQPENWTPEQAAGDGEGQATLYLQNDDAQTGDIVAEDQFEIPSSGSGDTMAEDLSTEHAVEPLQSSSSDYGAGQEAVSESENRDLEALQPETAAAASATPGHFEAASGGYDAAAATDLNAPATAPDADANEQLQTLQQECAELREALGKQENEREELVQRIFESENQLHCSQAQVQEYRQTVGDLQKELEEIQARQPDAESAEGLQEIQSELNQRALELEQARSQAQEQAEQQERLLQELRSQLASFEAELKQTRDRCAALEKELAAVRQDSETVASRLTQQQQANAEAAQRIQDLETELSRRAAEAEQAGAKAKQQTEESQRAEAELRRQLAAAAAEAKQDHERCAVLEKESRCAEDELRRQLEAATQAGKQANVAQKQAESKAAQLETELSQLRQAREEFEKGLKQEQEIAAELRAVNKDLEKQLQADKAAREAQTAGLEQQIAQGVANLARVTAALSKETGERKRSDERAAALNLQLQDLHVQSGRFLEGQRADQERIASLEAQLRQRDESLSRYSSELEQHKSEGRLVKEQLQKTRELNAHFRKNLTVFKEAHQRLNSSQKDLQDRFEAALEALQKNGSRLERETAEGQRLAAELERAQRDLHAETQRRESVENQLRQSAGAFKELESRAEREKAERQRLQQALESARFGHRERSRRAELDLGKAQAALEFEQVERKRREAQLARMRLVGLEATRRARLLRNTLQKQTREPLDNLYQSARRLLQLELGEDQKKLAESMLQDAMLVRTRLQEPVRKDSSGAPVPGPEQSSSAEQSAADEFSTKFFEKAANINPSLNNNER